MFTVQKAKESITTTAKKSGFLYYSYSILNPLVCCADRTNKMPGKHLQKVKIKAPIVKLRNISTKQKSAVF
jgi:hypothetical protein